MKQSKPDDCEALDNNEENKFAENSSWNHKKKNNDDQNQRCVWEDVISLNDYQRSDAKTDNREKEKRRHIIDETFIQWRSEVMNKHEKDKKTNEKKSGVDI